MTAYSKFYAAWEDSPSTDTPITAASLDHIEEGIETAAAEVTAHIADTIDAHDASAISYNPAGGINIGGTVDDVQEAIGTLDFQLGITNSSAANHLADTSDAHDASAISVVSAGFNGNLAPTDDTVQKVAQKLDDLAVGGGGAPSGAAGGSLAGTYPNPTLAADSVGASQIATNAVGASELADNAVDTAAIADGAVTFGKIAGAAIGTSGSTLAAGNHGHTTSGQVVFGIDGAATVRTGKARVYNDSGRNRTLTAVRLSADTAPTGTTSTPVTGAAMVADLNIGGTSVFTTQANRPAIPSGSNTHKTTGLGTTTWADNAYITVDIDFVGSTVAGSDVAVVVSYTEAI